MHEYKRSSYINITIPYPVEPCQLSVVSKVLAHLPKPAAIKCRMALYLVLTKGKTSARAKTD